jgi:hypothetical protein
MAEIEIFGKRIKGKAARQRAMTEFDRQRWVEEIIK